MPEVRPALHDLRAHRRNPVHGHQEGRTPRAFRPPENSARAAEILRETSVATAKLEALVDEVERFVHEAPERERKTSEIGELLMNRIKKLDKVAYVRFASVYLDFKDVKEFMSELKGLMKDRTRK